MIIVAILKHVAGKSADYGAALDYLKYEHDEVLKKPLLDANGNWVLRRNILLEGINCEPELFDVECEMLNAQYHKNQNYDEIKTHHYLISFDPADKDECGLTGEQAQAIGMEYVKANFPGHQALVCTHMDGHNGSGNIHVHIVINSLRKLDVPQQPSCPDLPGAARAALPEQKKPSSCHRSYIPPLRDAFPLSVSPLLRTKFMVPATGSRIFLSFSRVLP